MNDKGIVFYMSSKPQAFKAAAALPGALAAKLHLLVRLVRSTIMQTARAL